MSTSAIERGTVEHKKEAGDSLPKGTALDAEGDPTTDPTAALDGTILPFGGAKGSGLAIEVLTGGLVGTAMGQNVTGTHHTEKLYTKGDLFVAIDPSSMGVLDFDEQASAFLRQLQASDSAVEIDGFRLPGERSVEHDRSQSVIKIDSDLWGRVQSLSDGR